MVQVVARTLLSITGINLLLTGRRHQDNKSNRSDKLFRSRRFVALLSYIGLAVFVIRPTWSQQLQLPLPAWAVAAGLGLLIAHLCLWQWSARALGKNYSAGIAVGEKTSLVVNGPYHWVRHPMYTSYYLLAMGTLLATQNLAVSLPLIIYALLNNERAVDEESAMQRRFGRRYLRYKTRTGGMFPKLGQHH